jgi:hypothetical protein
MPAKARSGETGQAIADRITVALIPRAAEDLQQLHGSTGMTKTDLVNRAITLYKFIEARLRAGDELLIRDGKTRDIETVHIL